MLYLVLPSILPSNLPSVRFRVNPWQMLNLVLLSNLPSVKFRVNPWQMLTLVLPLFHTRKPPKLASFLVGHLVISSG